MSAKKISRREMLKGLSLALAGTTLAACAPPVVEEKVVEKMVTATPPPPAEVVIKQMSFPLGQSDVEMFRPIQDAFAEENPGVEVQVQIEPWKGRDAKMLAYIAAGNPPNCVYFNPDFYPKFLSADAVEPLDSYLEPGFRDDFVDGALGAVTYDGKTYGLPVLMAAYTQIFNYSLLEKAGIAELPTSFMGMREAADKVHGLGDDIWGARLDLGPATRCSPVTWFVRHL
jgi:ABC-type glycerol-3-phosphate transport system substrate-binding protein